VAVLVFPGLAAPQQLNNGSFTITISLQESTIHIDGETAIVTTFANPTGHAVTVGEGNNGGMAVEVVNGRGEDVRPKMMESANPNPSHIDRPDFGNSRQSKLRKGKKETYVWPFRADPQVMPPGKYKLRVHRRDLDKNAEVYSNEVTLTIVP
jgi:hypothetical protein